MDSFIDRVMNKLADLNTPRVKIVRIVVSREAHEELQKLSDDGESKYLKKYIGYDVELEPAYDECVAVIVYISHPEGGILRSTFVM